MTVGTVVLLPFAQSPSNIQSLGSLVVIGVIHTGLMTTLLYGAIQKISTSIVGTLSFIYPVVAIIVDWIAFGQRMGFMQVAGALVILT
ncbi:EamA family transporter [Brucella sp. TWI432]